MVIRKGVDWGSPGGLPEGAPLVASDAALADAVGNGATVVGLAGGDLARTLGGAGALAMTFPIDLLRLRADGVEHVAVAHAIVRRPGWIGPVLALMNAQFLGAWDVAPRSHPNDGLVDLLEANLGWRDRMKARRRLPLGTHVPHPGIQQRRLVEGHWTFARPTRLWIDGRLVGEITTLRVTVEPDAFTVVL
jgi:hypothetical protein